MPPECDSPKKRSSAVLPVKLPSPIPDTVTPPRNVASPS
jgi:hypothetical protein